MPRSTPTSPRWAIFEFAWVGAPLLLGTIAIIVGERLLPNRAGKTIPADLSKHARTLIEQYRLDDGLFQLRVRAGSVFAGAPAATVQLSDSLPFRAGRKADPCSGRAWRKATS